MKKVLATLLGLFGTPRSDSAPRQLCPSCPLVTPLLSVNNPTQQAYIHSGVRRKFSCGVLIQWHMVVICVWCALFVTSQF